MFGSLSNSFATIDTFLSLACSKQAPQKSAASAPQRNCNCSRPWDGERLSSEALDRIGALYDIETQITGKTAGDRLTIQQANRKPKVEAFRALGARSGCSPVPTAGPRHSPVP